MKLPYRQSGFTILEILIVVAVIGAAVAVASLSFNRDDQYEEIKQQGLRFQTFFEVLADETVFQNKDLGIVVLKNKVELFEFDYQALQTSLSALNQDESDGKIGFEENGLEKEDENAEISEWKPFEHEVLANIELPEPFEFELTIDDEVMVLEGKRDEEVPPEPSLFLWASGEVSSFKLEILDRDRDDLELLVLSDGLGRFSRTLKRLDDQ